MVSQVNPVSQATVNPVMASQVNPVSQATVSQAPPCPQDSRLPLPDSPVLQPRVARARRLFPRLPQPWPRRCFRVSPNAKRKV